MPVLFQALLPSGRAVRYEKIGTQEYLDCEERAAAKAGDRRDPGQARLKRARSLELIYTSLKFVTDVRPPVFALELDAAGKPVLVGGQPQLTEDFDVDAMLAAIPPDAWRAVDAVTLQTADAELSFGRLFEDVADFAALAGFIADTMGATKRIEPLAGKARKVVST